MPDLGPALFGQAGQFLSPTASEARRRGWGTPQTFGYKFRWIVIDTTDARTRSLTSETYWTEWAHILRDGSWSCCLT